jgi:hypothetical protein
MKVNFSSDEWYPVFTLLHGPNKDYEIDLSLDLTETEIIEFKDIYVKFDNWQRRLHKEYLNR